MAWTTSQDRILLITLLFRDAATLDSPLTPPTKDPSTAESRHAYFPDAVVDDSKLVLLSQRL